MSVTNSMIFKTIDWKEEKLILLDQRILPEREEYIEYTDYREVADAIRDMVVRGAPAIGVTAAFGATLGAYQIKTGDIKRFLTEFENVCKTLAESRPTAVNLFWALDRMKKTAQKYNTKTVATIKEKLTEESVTILEEDLAINKAMGENGSALIDAGDTILTHCNAGALATAGDYGTALGVIKAAHLAGKNIDVIADETRPWLQGARLTSWELAKENIPVKLICDNMAGALMNKGLIDKVVVGSDRIAGNGDIANKIGTYTVAVLAARHKIPFYVAAPMSTIDFSLDSGDKIPIEERSPNEVTNIMGKLKIAPEGVDAFNPAFDVTPNDLVSAIITEKGIATGNYTETLAAMLSQ